jgi:hypothetical protein
VLFHLPGHRLDELDQLFQIHRAGVHVGGHSVMARGDLTDEQWALVEPHSPIAAVGPIPDLRRSARWMGGATG